jgi:hypothetical protein
MLTLFSVPKPFRGHIGTIQRNAIESWLRLRPSCEIILLGDEEGTAGVAAEFGVRHDGEIAKNEFGTPLVDSILMKPEIEAAHPYMCYVNADILLMNDFMEAVRWVVAEQRFFLLVGQRWDLDVMVPLDFSNDWDVKLRSSLERHGQLHGHSGLDYFVYPKGFWGAVPPFAIGRLGWDNWLLYRARALGATLIDATEVVTAVHQNHDYQPEIAASLDTLDHPEMKRNLMLADGCGYAGSLAAATHRLTRGGLIPKRRGLYEIYRQLVLYSISYPVLKPIVRLIHRAGTRVKALIRRLVARAGDHARERA